MLKSPPGVRRRFRPSSGLDGAGAVFETLSRRYCPRSDPNLHPDLEANLEASDLQRRAEQYLTRPSRSVSFNQTTRNISSRNGSTNFTGSDKPERVNKDTKLVPKATANSTIAHQTRAQNDTDRLLEHLEEREDAKRFNTPNQSLSNPPLLTTTPSTITGSNRAAVSTTTTSTTTGIITTTGSSGPNEPQTSTTTTTTGHNGGGSRVALFEQKLASSDEPNYLTHQTRSVKGRHNLLDQPDFANADDFVQLDINSQTVSDNYSLVKKGKDLGFYSLVAMLSQALCFLVLFTALILVHLRLVNYNRYHKDLDALRDNRYYIINLVFPFLAHFALFYLIFLGTNYLLKKRFLLYSNDINVDVLSRRLRREICYASLSRLAVTGNFLLSLLSLVVASIPVTIYRKLGEELGASEVNLVKLLGATDYLYFSLLVGLLAAHLGFTFYYFNVKFKRLLVTF